jgi:hypothetical protein
MNKPDFIKKLKSVWPEDPLLSRLAALLIGVAILGAFSAITVFLATGYQDGIFLLNPCFTSDCVDQAAEYFSGPMSIIKETINLLVAIATIGGIIVALMSYITSVGTTALSNHISHFSIFQNYLNNEIARRDRISPTSIDTLFWYNAIFSDSRFGQTSISLEYIELVKSLNTQISQSNDQAKKTETDSFRYKPHQARLIQTLRSFGIQLTHQPRNDFYEIEGQVFSLISCVNKSFCYRRHVPDLMQRAYI